MKIKTNKQQNNKTKNKCQNKAELNKKFTEIPLSLSCVDQPLLPSYAALKKTDLPLPASIGCRQLGSGPFVHFSFSGLEPHLPWNCCRFCACCHNLCEFLCAPGCYFWKKLFPLSHPSTVVPILFLLLFCKYSWALRGGIRWRHPI